MSDGRTSGAKLAEDKAVSVKTLNSAFAKLISKDKELAASGDGTPSVWEQRWYSDRLNRSLFYNKGDAVWLNTESVDDVVAARQDDLYAYSASNPAFRKKLDECLEAGDRAQYLALLREFAVGNVDRRKGPVFFLGDLTANAQIRISKADGNTSYPDDDNYWEDFIVRKSDGQAEAEILSAYALEEADAISAHLSRYHLFGADVTASKLSSEFLLKDFSNLSGEQRLKSHMWYEGEMRGLDRVKQFGFRKFEGGAVKWFRLWSSGYLEHGGVVRLSDVAEGDAVVGGRYDVKLGWQWGSAAAPVYDYQHEDFAQTYGRETSYSSSGSVFAIPPSPLGASGRYFVQVTPFSSRPYAAFADGGYDVVETCFLANDGFSFVFGGFAQDAFSYRVEGYSVKGGRA